MGSARHPEHITKWWDAGETFGLATVVRTFRSAPRDPGAALAVAADGEVIGSVSGGCVEGAVYELCDEVIGSWPAGAADVRRQRRRRLRRRPDLRRHPGHLRRAGQPATLPRARRHRRRRRARGAGRGGHRDLRARRGRCAPGDLGDARDESPAASARATGWTTRSTTTCAACWPRARPASAATARTASAAATSWRVFVNSFAPPPRMMVFGAIDFAAAVARVGKFLGYHVTVCDARPSSPPRPGSRDADEVDRRLAAPLPGRRRGRRAHRDLRADPRPQVRRAGARGRAAHPGRLHRRDGHAAGPTRTGWTGCARSA